MHWPLGTTLLSDVFFLLGWYSWPESGLQSLGRGLSWLLHHLSSISLPSARGPPVVKLPGTDQPGLPHSWAAAAAAGFEKPAQNPQHPLSLFVFSFAGVLAFHRHSRSLLGIL